ncbi:MSCRAMM family adhesin SdrC [Natronosalvus rutilus]|uniref:MSCRAMM family adhesin SdrC n=1 Tax=Natronosalvus rutilus TaxID=2953753 RepID=A0A9E7NCB4_9EURY|nr:MSCRAMM family adhesin SdrC [Natronosalvus rutilus]UTF54067.1 MSCRAMM family adhesin SdrC [Natronosalvus rutilus]
MPPHSLETFVTRTRLLCEAAPPETLTETTPIVDMLLSALGWDTIQDCRRNVSVAGTTLEYVCSIEATPALFVAVDSASAFPSSDRLSALGTCLAETGVDRAIYTNGREAVLLAGTNSIDTHRCDLRRRETLEPLLEHYQRRALERRLGRHSRAPVARRLAVERTAVRETLVDDLEAVTGSAYTDELEAAVDRLLEHLVGSFSGTATASASGNADDGVPTFEGEGNSEDESKSAEESTRERVQYRDRFLAASDERGDSQSRSSSHGESTDSTHDRPTDSPSDQPTDSSARVDAGTSSDSDEASSVVDGDDDGEDGDSDASDGGSGDGDASDSEDGEYVARFFADHGSIGAIGHGSSTGALVHAAEFLLERGLSGVRVPWPESEPETPDTDGTLDRPVLVGQDGATRLPRSRQLSNGYHLNTAGSPTDHADRVEALGARAGYRVMLTGDWE